ncbi:MAG: 30S ribosomal protein S2 [Alphaproteobacteria bacterium]|nr:30S ribosomal protein S2 [Alphaproteobacteria bacterium]
MSTELPKFTIRQLLEAGVHFGHKTMRRNPKMEKYIFGSRNGITIIDLNKTANCLHNALKTVKEIAKNNGRILFVGTKKQAVEPVAEAAKRCGQYYVNQRWLGGMLTNWKTVSQSIKTLKKIEGQLSDTEVGYNKKEKLVLERQRQKLEDTLGGIKNMGGYPDLVFIIDTNKESIAFLEASKLNVPIMAVLDSNCNPDGVTFPIPGNDDSAKSIKLYCRLLSDAAIAGIKENMALAGIDVSKLEDDNVAEMKKPVEEKREEKNPARKEHKKIVKVVEKADEKPAKKVFKKPVKKAEEKAPAKKPVAKKPAAKK